jgi:hypothetical protein
MNIYDYEEEFIPESTCKNGNHYLSAVIQSSEKDTEGELIVDYRVNTQLFFKFSYSEVIEYAKTYDENIYFSDNLEIVQVVFKGELCTAVIKTYWLRVVQRAWKKYMNRRRDWIKNVKKNILRVLVDRSILPVYPSYKGILS